MQNQANQKEPSEASGQAALVERLRKETDRLRCSACGGTSDALCVCDLISASLGFPATLTSEQIETWWAAQPPTMQKDRGGLTRAIADALSTASPAPAPEEKFSACPLGTPGTVSGQVKTIFVDRNGVASPAPACASCAEVERLQGVEQSLRIAEARMFAAELRAAGFEASLQVLIHEWRALSRAGHCWTRRRRHRWSPWVQVPDLPWQRSRCERCGVRRGRYRQAEHGL